MVLHLSRFFPKQPPGPTAQRINALLHEEPYSIIAHGVYWFMFLMVVAPVFGGLGVLAVTVAKLGWWLYDPEQISANSDSHRLAVVVTGCDTGFGKEMVSELVEKGFVVFCGCLDEKSFAQFEGMPDAIPLQIDVTSDEQVKDASKRVQDWLNDEECTKKKKRYLHALVNNAGMGKIGYVDWLNVDSYQICMDVNCFGMIRMVKAFLPIFKKQVVDKTHTNSQIINVVSMAGMLSGGGLAMTAYETSKNAAEAFTDGLRLEMKIFGISVVSVNPSFHKTPLVEDIGGKMRRMLWLELPAETRKEYGEDFFNNYATHVETSMNAAKWDMSVVSNQMIKVLLSKYPPAQVLLGSDAKFSLVWMRMIPQWLRHLLIGLLIPPQIPAMLQETGPANSKPNSKEKSS